MWILKAFGVALATALILFVIDFWFLSRTSRATGLVYFHDRGVFLIYVGAFQVVIGLLLSRIGMMR
jgi:hypothetical protein